MLTVDDFDGAVGGGTAGGGEGIGQLDGGGGDGTADLGVGGDQGRAGQTLGHASGRLPADAGIAIGADDDAFGACRDEREAGIDVGDSLGGTGDDAVVISIGADGAEGFPAVGRALANIEGAGGIFDGAAAVMLARYVLAVACQQRICAIGKFF